jgi:hypothetical protein
MRKPGQINVFASHQHFCSIEGTNIAHVQANAGVISNLGQEWFQIL